MTFFIMYNNSEKNYNELYGVRKAKNSFQFF